MQVGTRLGTKYVGSGWVVKTKMRKSKLDTKLFQTYPSTTNYTVFRNDKQTILSFGKNPIPVPKENPLKQRENHARRPSDTSLNSS